MVSKGKKWAYYVNFRHLSSFFRICRHNGSNWWKLGYSIFIKFPHNITYIDGSLGKQNQAYSSFINTSQSRALDEVWKIMIFKKIFANWSDKNFDTQNQLKSPQTSEITVWRYKQHFWWNLVPCERFKLSKLRTFEKKLAIFFLKKNFKWPQRSLQLVNPMNFFFAQSQAQTVLLWNLQS